MRPGWRAGAAVLAVASLALCGAVASFEPEAVTEILSLRELQEHGVAELLAYQLPLML
eukprot:CAMPEP_0202051600 /NCGR_PEP_ID=MMETSP0963-20130614/4723_1 /ASSEMBLY_ACC=CAM_ASM_000494 /TAXON_ID=4773 /ORGANISM="Schizochytrium aggregatum, Strain ATCC28209" /LENGTH=57 /DNA_ID=CAMNT_0048616787 /DNA_START=169 /DNA_END=343 /DNA_ORIENTATION=-